ncbi:hypothetical protein GCM10009578_046870 [Streptomyces rhizosphaericus]
MGGVSRILGPGPASFGGYRMALGVSARDGAHTPPNNTARQRRSPTQTAPARPEGSRPIQENQKKPSSAL